MSVIKILDQETANSIKAGEVIERPVSVVKELFDNSVDAGADNIRIEISGGGIELIRVTDNGCGMTAEDAKLAFLLHATSKLTKYEDIFSIPESKDPSCPDNVITVITKKQNKRQLTLDNANEASEVLSVLRKKV